MTPPCTKQGWCGKPAGHQQDCSTVRYPLPTSDTHVKMTGLYGISDGTDNYVILDQLIGDEPEPAMLTIAEARALWGQLGKALYDIRPRLTADQMLAILAEAPPEVSVTAYLAVFGEPGGDPA